MREELNVEELFASKVFTLGKMKERLTDPPVFLILPYLAESL